LFFVDPRGNAEFTLPLIVPAVLNILAIEALRRARARFASG
jgi:hypothetical protein